MSCTNKAHRVFAVDKRESLWDGHGLPYAAGRCTHFFPHCKRPFLLLSSSLLAFFSTTRLSRNVTMDTAAL